MTGNEMVDMTAKQTTILVEINIPIESDYFKSDIKTRNK